jgi:hypothetical protein
MKSKISKLEEFVVDARERLIKIETKLDGMNSRMATKSDLHESASKMIKWMVGTAVGLGVAAITVISRIEI